MIILVADGARPDTLAAAMDSRGYGRSASVRPAARRAATALLLGGITGSATLTMLFLGITGTVLRAIHLYTIMGASGARPRRWIADYGKTALISVPALFIPGLASLLSRPLLTFAAVVVGFGVYALLLIRQEKRPAS